MNISEIKSRVFVGIPSLSRPEYITKKTMSWLKNCGVDFKIFVEPQERFLYKQYNGDCIVTLPESGRGLMYSLNYIREYAKDKGYEFLFQLDDDVDGFARIDTDDVVEAFHKTVVGCYEAMMEFEKLGGIRFTQYRYWIYSKKKMHQWTHYNRPMQGICMLRLCATEHINDNMSEFTDTLTSLYMWRKGYFTLNYGLSGLKVVQNANKGGCQTQDRAQLAKNTIDLLKVDFPLVTEKVGSSWFGIDVDISAYIEKFGYKCINCSTEELKNNL